MKKLHLLFLLVSFVQVFAQKNIAINGKVLFDTIAVKDVHIFNKSTLKGAVTNAEGLFSITVSVDDVLFITSLAYEVSQIKIDSLILKNKFLLVKLKQQINNLEEVVVNSHNLSGSLLLDTKKVPDNFEKEDKIEIEISEADPYAVSDFTEPNDRKLKNPTGDLMDATPVDLIQIFSRLTSGIRKRNKLKKQEKEFNKQISKFIIAELGNDFFTKELKIPLDEIEDFMEFCNDEKLKLLYKNNQKIELIDSLILKSKLYKNKS